MISLKGNIGTVSFRAIFLPNFCGSTSQSHFRYLICIKLYYLEIVHLYRDENSVVSRIFCKFEVNLYAHIPQMYTSRIYLTNCPKLILKDGHIFKLMPY
jgi:hypothetical protein